MTSPPPSPPAPEELARPRVRVAAVLVREDTVLLVRHAKAGETYWLLPGGGCQFGETLEQALVREVQEETNLTVRVHDLVLAHDAIAPDATRHILNLCFRVELAGGTLECGADPRLVEARFVPISEAATLPWRPDVRDEILAAIRAGFPDRAPYLGNRWQDTPGVPRPPDTLQRN